MTNINQPIDTNKIARMPLLFVGHGTPMNAIEDNQWSQGFSRLASLIPTPKAILSVSAHWFVEGTFVTANPQPRTIHDFGGFPNKLYEIQYPVQGDQSLVNCVVDILGKDTVSLNNNWGIDHGTWSVLRNMYPKAEYPVVQLSIDYTLSAEKHLKIGKQLSVLRDQGYLIIGSGNITHNLDYVFSRLYRGDESTPSWALEFDTFIENAINNRLHGDLIKALENNPGKIAHPTPDHYLPLLYVIGASDDNDSITYPIKGFDMGSLSMRSVILGNTN